MNFPHPPRANSLFEEARHATERRTFQIVIESLEAEAETLENRAHTIRSILAELIDPEYDAACKAFPNAREIEEIAADLRGTLFPTQDDTPHTPDIPEGKKQ